MNGETFRAYTEFSDSLQTEQQIKNEVVRKAETTLRKAYEENGEKPIHFNPVWCEDDEGDYLGEFSTVDFSKGMELYGEKRGDGYQTDLNHFCHRDLGELIKSVVGAIDWYEKETGIN
ncbi:MAG: hypothetical protein LUD72_11190 [Bacteroidales bacterium]|nr:hypothetical protein [Bacteroidales bacterium]